MFRYILSILAQYLRLWRANEDAVGLLGSFRCIYILGSRWCATRRTKLYDCAMLPVVMNLLAS